MAHQLTVRPHEGAVYLPKALTTSTEELGERLSCVVHLITVVWAVTKEALVVETMEQVTIAPMACAR